MIGLLPPEDATAALVRMDRASSVITASMTTTLGGFQERQQAAMDLRRLSERMADLARRIDPIESGDYAMAIGADQNLRPIQMRG